MDQEGLNLMMMMNKGKRTKRLSRMALTSSDEEEEDMRSYGSAVTEEEHDMANCLILLARGGEEKKIEVGIEVGGKRKAAVMGGGGCCYECKTCNKTFASFQALGGHRTSHRKIKSEISVSGSDSDVMHSSLNCSISLQISTSTSSNKTKNGGVLGSRVHQCSICGSEFSSGQALGGHMRRHRAIPIRFSAPENSITDHQSSSSSDAREVKTTRSCLSLDLNLPAPEDCEISQNAAFQLRETTTLVCAPLSLVVGLPLLEP
ncbi:hypothetical protein QQ045_033411 [Rhodiola kirilowii]